MLASCWYQRISPTCCRADFDSRIKISGNLLGQNDQNFEIYTFDWSQVASWGLAAEGEALKIIAVGVETLLSSGAADRSDLHFHEADNEEPARLCMRYHHALRLGKH